MAADLVEDPTIPQKLEHDLESFFWVLFWIILMHVPCSWNNAIRSKFIEDTMNPKVYGQSGGQAKKTFLTNTYKLRKRDFDIPHNERLRTFLHKMKEIVAPRHHPPPDAPTTTPSTPTDPNKKTPDLETQVENYGKEQDEYLRGLKSLQSHDSIRELFEWVDVDQGWPTDDRATYQRRMHSRTADAVSNSGSKRSRDIAEQNGIYLQPSSSKRQA
jgi:hypothetical protein